MSDFNASERRELRRVLLANGVPADRADMIVDLACHAAEQAVKSLTDVIRRAPDSSVGLMALEIALQIAPARMKGMLERTQQAGAAMGVPVYKGQVGLRT